MIFFFGRGGANLTDIQLISKFNKGIRFLLCVFDNFSKYAWITPLKDTKVITITNAFWAILSKSKRKPNKIWVDKGSRFYSKLIKSWLQHNNMKIYSKHNEEKYFAAERFIRTLKTKIYKY